MEADAPALGQSDKVVALDKPKTRVEPTAIASDAASMKAAQRLDLKFWATIIMIIVGVLAIINTSNVRIDRLETSLNMRINRLEDNMNNRIVESETRTNQSLDRLETSLNTRIDDTNKLIGVLLDLLQKEVSLGGSFRGAVESPLTSEIMP